MIKCIDCAHDCFIIVICMCVFLFCTFPPSPQEDEETSAEIQRQYNEQQKQLHNEVTTPTISASPQFREPLPVTPNFTAGASATALDLGGHHHPHLAFPVPSFVSRGGACKRLGPQPSGRRASIDGSYLMRPQPVQVTSHGGHHVDVSGHGSTSYAVGTSQLTSSSAHAHSTVAPPTAHSGSGVHSTVASTTKAVAPHHHHHHTARLHHIIPSRHYHQHHLHYHNNHHYPRPHRPTDGLLSSRGRLLPVVTPPPLSGLYEHAH